MRNGAIASLLVVSILAGAGAGYLIGNTNEHAVTSISTATAQPPWFVNSLQLAASVEPTHLTQGQNVTVTAWIYSPLAYDVTVTWAPTENPSEAPCSDAKLTRVSVYAGNHTFGDLSTASPLLQWNASVYPTCLNLGMRTSTFEAYGGTIMAETTTLGGYYVLSGTANGLSRYVFQSFPPGTYTIVVFDAFGQQVIQYFQVS